MVIIVVVVAMDMDDVPRFELARDNMPISNLAQAARLSKGNSGQGSRKLQRLKNQTGAGQSGLGFLQFTNIQRTHVKAFPLDSRPRFRKRRRKNHSSI